MQGNFMHGEYNENLLAEKSLLPTNDVIFHCLFGTVGNEKITKDLLEKLLNKKIENIELDRNVNLIREHYDDKLGILDVRLTDEDGTNYNIEMQNTSSEQLPHRILWYWSKLYVGDLKKGHDYTALNKTIAIIILNDQIERFDEIKKYETKWNIREEDYREIILTDDLEIRIIELPKYIRMKKVDKLKVNTWLEFILNPKRKEELEGMEDDMIEEARRKWEEIISNEEIRDRALRREVAEFDRNTAIKVATDKGIEQGSDEARKEIAKEMLKNGDSIEYIEKITKLSKSEINELKNEIDN